MQINPYALAFATVVLGAIIAKVYLSIARKITARARVDKSIAKAYELPISIIIFLTAFYVGINFVALPINVSNFLTQATIFIIAMLCAYSIAQLLEALLKRYLLAITTEYEARIYIQLLSFFGAMIKGTIIAVVAALVLANFGYDVAAILAGFGVFGLAIALAAADVLKDVLGGLFICITRPFVVGDAIDVEGIAHGKVERIDLLHTCLRDAKGNMITIPNSRIRALRITTIARPELKVEEKLHEEIVLNLPYAISASRLNKLTKAILSDIKATKGCANPSIRIELSDKVRFVIAYQIVDVPKANVIRNRIALKIKRGLEKEKIALS